MLKRMDREGEVVIDENRDEKRSRDNDRKLGTMRDFHRGAEEV
jgi:hypothetical protein